MKYTCCSGLETIASIPSGDLIVPSTRTVATTKPAFPGGRCSGLPVSFLLVISGENGSRLFATVSVVAAGLVSGLALASVLTLESGLGFASDFALVPALDLAVLAGGF